MQVTVALFGPYARLLPEGSAGGRAILEVSRGTAVRTLLDRLEVPEGGRRYVTVNGDRVPLEHELADADEVKVIVPLGGG